jgi:hypothetical protein
VKGGQTPGFGQRPRQVRYATGLSSGLGGDLGDRELGGWVTAPARQDGDAHDRRLAHELCRTHTQAARLALEHRP